MHSNRSLGEQWADCLLEAARAKGDAMRARKLAERVYDRILLVTDGKTVAEREARARTHDKFIVAEDHAIEAESAAVLAKASADAAEAVFSEWQSRNATARAEMQIR